MNYMTNGTSAYKYYPEEKNVVNTGKAKRTTISVARRNTIKRMFAMCGIVVGLAFLLLARSAHITKQTNEIARLNNKINAVDAKIVEKEYKMERDMDLAYVESVAVSKLGMQHPSKSQIVYVDTKADDYIEKKTENVTGSFTAFISGLFD